MCIPFPLNSYSVHLAVVVEVTELSFEACLHKHCLFHLTDTALFLPEKSGLCIYIDVSL